jgi:peptidyl-prolyl cis-trans isomerase SurA
MGQSVKLCYAKPPSQRIGIDLVWNRISLGLALCLIALGPAIAQDVRIAAVVNDGIVTTGDLNNRTTLILRSSGIQDTPENRQRLATRVLRTLIDEKLEMQEAKRLKVTVSKTDLDAALERLEKQNNLPKGGLDQFLHTLGIPKESLVEQLTAALDWNKVVEGRMAEDVSVTDQEVADSLKRLKEDIQTPQSNVAEIFLAVDNPAQDDEVRRLADRLEQQIRSGGNFSAIAQQFSQSPTAADGGSLGWITPSEINPNLGTTLAGLKTGEISEPIRAAGGYYILALLDRRIPGQGNPNETRLSVVEAGAPLPPNAPAEFRTRLAQALQELVREAHGCPAFAAAAHKIGLPFVKDAPNLVAATMSPAVRRIALGLTVGEVSKPFPVQGGVGLVMLCSRKDAAAPKPPTLDQVRESMLRERLDVLGRRYLRDLRRDAYVDIRG